MGGGFIQSRLSLLKELLNQILQLLNYRKNRQRELFDKLIEPTYRGAQVVIADLLVFFREVRVSIQVGKWEDPDSAKSLGKVQDYIQRASVDPDSARSQKKLRDYFLEQRDHIEEIRDRFVLARRDVSAACQTFLENPGFDSRDTNKIACEMCNLIPDVLNVREGFRTVASTYVTVFNHFLDIFGREQSGARS